MINEIDGLKFKIYEKFIMNDKSESKFRNSTFSSYTKRNNKYIIKTSGKIVSNPTFLGGITSHNLDYFLQRLYEDLQILINKEDFLNFAQILTIEFKKDIIPEYDKNTSISKLHEKLHESSNKNQILFYSSKNIGFNNGIVIKPIAKTTGKSYIIYSKLAELKAHKSSNPAYFEQFELQYLEEIKNLLRFEVRFVKFADLKKALQLSNRKEIYAKDVFFSKINVVQNEFEKFLK